MGLQTVCAMLMLAGPHYHVIWWEAACGGCDGCDGAVNMVDMADVLMWRMRWAW